MRTCNVIRRAGVQDLTRLQDIERAAGAPFRGVGMAAIADDDPPTLENLRAYQAAGRAWVASEDDDVPVAYLLVDVVDDAAHVEQVSVHPDYARCGVGRELIETAAQWACEQGLQAVTLTTFAEVAWNAPYYTRLGFKVIEDGHAGPELQALRRHEREKGLDAWPRVSMRRPVGTDAGGRSARE